MVTVKTSKKSARPNKGIVSVANSGMRAIDGPHGSAPRGCAYGTITKASIGYESSQLGTTRCQRPPILPALVDISPLPVPVEAFDRFPGRWVAIRDGDIVADASTLEELEADTRTDSSDTVFRVPEPGSKFL
jgi:Family of unknown function (DUF5678)